ncbi:MAG: aspartate-semialdehyde dehydrogenase [Candidatus Omnitrophota bacterium]
MKRYNVAIVGVGAVGREILRVLRQRNFPLNELRVFARRARDVDVDGRAYAVRPIEAQGFRSIDIALFAGTEGEKGAAVTYAAEAVKQGAIVIDNGADFRLRSDVPLVVPEINSGVIEGHHGIIANPNCSTIQMVMALWPIYKISRVSRVIVTTLQAVSGAGTNALSQLYQESREHLGIDGKQRTNEERALPHTIAFNVIPQIGGFKEYGYTSEEWKMIYETRKIIGDDKIKITATTVRVPVETGHSLSVYIETERPLSLQEAQEALSCAPGINLIGGQQGNIYPMPKDAVGKDAVFVGRLRKDLNTENGLWFWCVADNLRKGAALNAVQIAENITQKNNRDFR